MRFSLHLHFLFFESCPWIDKVSQPKLFFFLPHQQVIKGNSL